MLRTTNFAIMAALVGVSFLALASCQRDGIFDCEHSIGREVPSQNGQFRAAVDTVQCGATTKDASWVLLTERKSGFKPDLDKAAVFEGAIDQLQWSGTKLTVFYADSKPFLMKKSISGVTLEYVPEKGGSLP